jgi:hypothetical protein
MERKINTRFITRTALLLAIVIVFQLLGRFMGPYNNFIVGPIVNAVLIIATAASGLWSGTAIAVIAPIVSALTNKAAIAPIILAFSPFIAAGNFIIVLSFSLLMKKSKVAGVITGAIVKFAFLYGAITVFAGLMNLKPKVASSLTTLFSWPQLVTALVGGVIALIVIKLMGKQLGK